MIRELGSAMAGRYALLAKSRSGVKLELGIRTYLSHGESKSGMGGAIDLLSAVSPRTYLDMGA